MAFFIDPKELSPSNISPSSGLIKVSCYRSLTPLGQHRLKAIRDYPPHSPLQGVSSILYTAPPLACWSKLKIILFKHPKHHFWWVVNSTRPQPTSVVGRSVFKDNLSYFLLLSSTVAVPLICWAVQIHKAYLPSSGPSSIRNLQSAFALLPPLRWVPDKWPTTVSTI